MRWSFKYISVEEAQRIIDKLVSQPLGVEDVDISSAYRRVLAEDVVSRVDVPTHDVTHFDGYALRTSDVRGASPSSPVKLRIKGRAYPSTPKPDVIDAGEALYVTTGSWLPVNADGVLPVEAAIVREGYLEVKYAVKPGEHVIKAGSDVKRGEVILRRGSRLRGQDLTLLTLLGYGKVKVYRRPKVGVISVGDELTEDYEHVEPGKTPNGHALMICSFVERDGGVSMNMGIVRDDPEEIKEVVGKALESCDVVVTISGASKGEKDYVEGVLNELGEPGVVFHGLKIKPGRQTGFAMVGSKPIVMLPGLCHSTIVGYQVVASRVIRNMLGLIFDHEKPLKVKVAVDVKLPQPKGFKRVLFMRVESVEGELLAWPLMGESALVSIPVRAYGYVVFSEGLEEVPKGSLVDLYPLM